MIVQDSEALPLVSIDLSLLSACIFVGFQCRKFFKQDDSKVFSCLCWKVACLTMPRFASVGSMSYYAQKCIIYIDVV